MTKEDLKECIDFFDRLSIIVVDITNDADKAKDNKVVEVEYKFDRNIFRTKPLYYKEITKLDDVRDIALLHIHFGEDVYLLDIEKHKWPKPSGESDLDKLVINDIIKERDDSFKSFLLKLANNKQTGFIQRITKDGRPGQYYHNLENNNHWHDLILLIKEAILKKGETVSKDYFKHLVFNWDKGRRTSLNAIAPYKIIKDLYKNLHSINTSMLFNDVLNLLRYKKQIILQGPPGTGKTKLAKEIASALTHQFQLNENDISDLLKIGDKLPSVKGNTEYRVKNIEDKKVILSGSEIEDKKISFKKIEDFFRQSNWNQSVTNGDDRGAYSIAYFIYQKKQQTEQVKIIQFHPSYSYEDFVRGIVAETTEKSITYKVKNKLLCEFAAYAHENYLDAHKNINDLQKEKLFERQFEKFISQIESELSQGPIQLTPKVNLVTTDSDAFIYNGNNWEGRIVYSQLKKLYNYNINSIDDVHQHPDIAKHIIYRTPYYFSVLNRLRNFISGLPKQETAEFHVESSLNNYVLLIDEINRANLSSVLGELIYALEYRGERVESMYEVEGQSELVLPPNLYIIGTMNTADRSVGHIDYAIRRRFAFVDVLPKDLSGEMGSDFKSNIFKKVYDLFYDDDRKYLSSEFEPGQVCLGHSYFIQQYNKDENGIAIKESPVDFKIRLKYEIIPILNEYIRDGVLKDSKALRDIIGDLENGFS